MGLFCPLRPCGLPGDVHHATCLRARAFLHGLSFLPRDGARPYIHFLRAVPFEPRAAVRCNPQDARNPPRRYCCRAGSQTAQAHLSSRRDYLCSCGGRIRTCLRGLLASFLPSRLCRTGCGALGHGLRLGQWPGLHVSHPLDPCVLPRFLRPHVFTAPPRQHAAGSVLRSDPPQCGGARTAPLLCHCPCQTSHAGQRCPDQVQLGMERWRQELPLHSARDRSSTGCGSADGLRRSHGAAGFAPPRLRLRRDGALGERGAPVRCVVSCRFAAGVGDLPARAPQHRGDVQVALGRRPGGP
mmetsp:Transcript_15916/g.43396  ORF Transcript_15916/g.43396 Transcript_15916/m.43396 type:complete len:298 (+) Transcript_15916:148-1041(+)